MREDISPIMWTNRSNIPDGECKRHWTADAQRHANGVYKRTYRRMYRSVVVGEALTLARCGHADAVTVAVVAVALTIIAPDFITGALALSRPSTAWYVSVVGKSRSYAYVKLIHTRRCVGIL